MLLPAFDLAEIISGLAALHLEPTTVAQILAAVFAPLLRSSDPELSQLRAGRPRSKSRRAPRRKRKTSRPRVAAAAAGEPTDGPE
jgi:hypothetical protein